MSPSRGRWILALAAIGWTSLANAEHPKLKLLPPKDAPTVHEAPADLTALVGKKPSEVYRIYLDAMKRGDRKAALTTQSRLTPGGQTLTDHLILPGMEIAKGLVPESPAIVEVVQEEEARLDVTGKIREPGQSDLQARKGVILLRRESGVWKIFSQDWSAPQD